MRGLFLSSDREVGVIEQSQTSRSVRRQRALPFTLSSSRGDLYLMVLLSATTIQFLQRV